MWVILALQSSGAMHLGVDNLGVVRHVGRLLNGHRGSVPLDIVTDDDLLETVRVSQVKRHADEGMILDGRVREQDRAGDDIADEAADFGRRSADHADYLFPGLMSLLVFLPWLRILGFGLIGCLMLALP